MNLLYLFMIVINGIGEYVGSNQCFINGFVGYWVIFGDKEWSEVILLVKMYCFRCSG